MQGIVFNIQRYCTHDGPGIRTTVYLKGCPLRCAWCHNPESQDSGCDLLFNPTLCIDCRTCEKACPQGDARRILTRPAAERVFCKTCLKCAEGCPSGAIEKVGLARTAEQVMEEVEKDRPFYKESGGGITLSGGEPMAQFRFSRRVLKLAKASGIHTCLETCGVAPSEHFAQILPYVDIFLWDVKDTDAGRHRTNTGAPLKQVLDNLKSVDRLGGCVILRCIIIAGVNMRPEHLQNLAAIHHGLKNVLGLELIPYHPYGESKRQKMRVPSHVYPNGRPTPEEMEAARSYLALSGVPCGIAG